MTAWPMERRIWWLAAAALVVVLLAPLASVEIPPLLDYPNHLARLYVLAHGAADPFLSRVYASHWRIIPDVAIDLIGPALLAVLKLEVAGKILLAIALLLPVLGTIAYGRTVCGVRSPWALGSGLVAYNFTFMLGFLNSVIATGAALLAAACWARWRERHPAATIAGVSGLAVLIFFLHLIGVLFLGLLIAAQEAVALWREWRGGVPLLARIARRGAAAALVFVLPLALYAASPLAASGEAPSWIWHYWAALWLFGPFLNYSLKLDIGTGVLVACCAGLGLLSRRTIVAPPAAIAVLVLLAAYPFVPYAMQSGSYVNARLPIMVGFLVFAGMAPRLPRPVGIGVAASLGGVFLLRMAVLLAVWHGQGRDVADFRRIIGHIPRGSLVLATTLERDDNPAYWDAMPAWRMSSGDQAVFEHLPALLVSERGATWPLLFTNPANQPLVVRGPFLGVTKDQGWPPDFHLLQRDQYSSGERLQAPYLAGWQDKYDYVLVLAAGGAGDLDRLRPGVLELIDRSDIAALLRVAKPARGAAAP